MSPNPPAHTSIGDVMMRMLESEFNASVLLDFESHFLIRVERENLYLPTDDDLLYLLILAIALHSEREGVEYQNFCRDIARYMVLVLGTPKYHPSPILPTTKERMMQTLYGILQSPALLYDVITEKFDKAQKLGYIEGTVYRDRIPEE